MADVRQEDRQLGHVHVAVVYEDKKQDEADEGGHEDEEPEEEPLAGPDAVDPRVGDHLAGGDAHPIRFLVAPVSEAGYRSKKYLPHTTGQHFKRCEIIRLLRPLKLSVCEYSCFRTSTLFNQI